MKSKTNQFIIVNFYKFLSIENKMSNINTKKFTKFRVCTLNWLFLQELIDVCDCWQQRRFFDIDVCTMKWADQRDRQTKADCFFCITVTSVCQ